MGFSEAGLANILQEIAADKAAAQKKRVALAPHFETEEAALEYAKRLTQLKPGDRVKIPNKDDSGLMNAVFVGENSEDWGTVVSLWYDSDEKRLVANSLALYAIVLD